MVYLLCKQIRNAYRGGNKMTWNEFSLFWQEENMNMFSVLIGLYIVAIVMRSFKAQSKQMQYRSKEANK